MQEFIHCLKNETIFLSDQASVPFQVKAKLPEQKQELVDGIQNLIDKLPENQLREHRKMSEYYF